MKIQQNSDYTPTAAVDMAQRLLGFDEAFANTLYHELNETDVDPVLVIFLNQQWMAIHGENLANQVADHIATFLMPAMQRRDAKKDCYRKIFHFKDSSELALCRDDVLQNYPAAFAYGPDAIARGFLQAGAPTMPMAQTVVVNKIAVQEDDVFPFDFFHL